MFFAWSDVSILFAAANEGSLPAFPYWHRRNRHVHDFGQQARSLLRGNLLNCFPIGVTYTLPGWPQAHVQSFPMKAPWRCTRFPKLF